jgi:pimeloyl-ACP methyl ester carboxylesterase
MTKLTFLDPNPSGTPGVLLLHGLGVNASSWTLQFPPLIEAGLRPLAPDAPGFGASPYDGRGWSLKRAAVALADLLDELATGPVHVVGLSMGGAIAQQLALDHPHLVKKLILASSFAALRPERPAGWFYLLQRVLLISFKGIPQQAEFVAARLFPAPEQEPFRRLFIEQILQADPRAYRAAMRALGLFDTRRRLAQIKAPTLIISGANDGTASPFLQKTLAQGIPGARQVVIAGAGHAVSVDHAEEFNRAMLEFLGEVAN